MIEKKDSNPKTSLGIRKVSLSVVPANVLMEVAVAMTEGSLKYGRHNYRTDGALASVYYDATMRHLMAWWEGENIDLDSGLSHITKAISSLVVLRDAMSRGVLTDDRPKETTYGFVQWLNAVTSDLLDKYTKSEGTNE